MQDDLAATATDGSASPARVEADAASVAGDWTGARRMYAELVPAGPEPWGELLARLGLATYRSASGAGVAEERADGRRILERAYRAYAAAGDHAAAARTATGLVLACQSAG